ncbi:MAG: AMP-binding protein [Clostridia bacterium]|nr:AMP-binding protein [Clostridia bacterium]
MNRGKNYPLYETTVFPEFRFMVDQSAEKHPDSYALSYKVHPNDEEVIHITYTEARKDIIALGTEEIAMGLRDKKVAVIGGCSHYWIYTYFSLMAIGAVTVPLDKEMPAPDLAATIKRGDCMAVFYGPELASKLDIIKAESGAEIFVCMADSVPADASQDIAISSLISAGAAKYAAGDNSYYDYEIDPDRLASIVFTSGTTGKGKGVMLSQTNIVSDMTQGMYNFNITPKTLMLLPPHHTFGSTVNIVGHYAQGSEIYLTSGIKYLMREIQEQKPKHLILVPLFVETLYRRIWAQAEKSGEAATLRKGMKLSGMLRKIGIDKRRTIFKKILHNFGDNLEMIICGGAALNQDIIDFFDAIGITILNGYGITEASPLISCNRNEWQKNGSVGLPIIGEEVKIADPDENGEGEICVKGPNVMLGYYDDPEATAAVFDDEGYFHTGDYGKIDADGWIYITGRLKNLIIFGNGKNVYPEEIETEISRIRGVLEVVVYAGESKSDPGKEVIVAEIYPDYEQLKGDGIEGDEAIQKYFNDNIKVANSRMAPYKKVGLVKVRKTEFIKNTSRKITRFNIDKSID